jgi:KaiC/GvpD/RAD55 family RecA-like ATPase
MTIEQYTKEVEDLFIQFLYTDPEVFVRVKNIMNPRFFDDVDNRKLVQLFMEYTDEHTSMPTDEQILALTGKKIEKIDEINPEHIDWFMDEFETFCQRKAAQQAVYDGMDLIKEDNLGELVERVKKAAELGIVRDLGIDYFESPAERLKRMRDNSKMVATGWASIDKKLYGGLERGTLTIWAGQSGAGKSLFLQNQALNWAEMGLNVVYITLELSEDLTSMRMDAMTSGLSTKHIMKNIDDVDLKVRAFQKACKNGSLRIKQLPNASTSNDIRAYLKEYEIQSGKKIDAVLVDYLDLCAPIDKRVSPGDLFIKDKYVSEELRNIAIELDVLMVTASQLNRGSHDEIEFGHNHIAGGISKINTADNVIAIFTTISMKESGRYQIQFMKTRSSAGVGSKVDLKFDIASLRIVDLEEGEEGTTMATAEKILGSLKRSNIVTDIQETEGENATRSGAGTKQKAKALRDLIKHRNI